MFATALPALLIVFRKMLDAALGLFLKSVKMASENSNGNENYTMEHFIHVLEQKYRKNWTVTLKKLLEFTVYRLQK